VIDSDDENKTSLFNTGKNDLRTKGELQMSDLPPIEDLKISVEESKCEPVGCIKSVVDTLGKYKHWSWKWIKCLIKMLKKSTWRLNFIIKCI